MNKKYIFYQFYVTLFINLTSFFYPISAQLGLPFQLQGALFLGSSLLVLVAASFESIKLFKNAWVVGLFLLIVCIPICTILYSPIVQLREVALPLLFFLLIFASIVSVQVRGWPEFWKILEFALIANIIGLIVSFFLPSQFLELFGGGKGEYTLGAGRAPGLFVNGNQSAKAITMLTIGWLAIPRCYLKFWRVSPLILATFIAIAMTGSRSGLLVYAFIAGTALIYHHFAKSGRKFSAWKLYLVFVPILLPLVLGLFIIILNLLLPYLVDEYATNKYSLTGRLQTYAQGPKAIYEDLSSAAENRWAVSVPYWDAAKDKPILGHGVRSIQYMRYMSGLELISHNTFVTFAYEYGIPYMIVFPIFILSFLRLPYRKKAEAYFSQPLMVYFISTVFLFYMTDGGGHELRPTWIVLGGIIGLMIRPPLVIGNLSVQKRRRSR